MLRIVSHIEQLLQVHECVIVPGIGGFVSHKVPTAYNADTHLFIPFHKEIVFNGSLQHNDGLLIESYMKAYAVDFNEGLRMVEKDIELLQVSLRHSSIVRIGSIGKLLLGDSGQLVFESGDSYLSVPEAYGLAVLQVKTLQALQQEEAELLIAQRKREADTFYIPVRKKVLRGIAATAAAVALFLFVSTPVKDVDRTAYSASLFPVEIPVVHDSPEIVPEEDAFTFDVTEEIPVVSVVEEVQPAPKPEVTNQKMYHIIIGSFVTDKQADEFMEKADRSLCPAMNKISRDERIRVYANKFDNRKEAEDYLETIRLHPGYQDAWLFISR